MQKLSGEIGIDDKVLSGILEEAKKGQGVRKIEAAKRGNEKKMVLSREYRLQENLLGFIFLNPGAFGKMFAELKELFEDKDFLEIYCTIEDFYKNNGVLRKEDLEQIKLKLADKLSYLNGSQNLSFLLDAAVFSVESNLDEEELNPLREAEKCIVVLREINLKKELEKLAFKIKEAEGEGNAKLLEELGKKQSLMLQKKEEINASRAELNF